MTSYATTADYEKDDIVAHALMRAASAFVPTPGAPVS